MRLGASTGFVRAVERWHRSPIGFIGWCASMLGLIVSVAIIIMIGPTFQSYVFALLKSDASSIYDTAYSGSLAAFPTLEDWLSSTSNWPYVLVALIAVPISIRRASALKVLVAGSLTFTSLLLLADVAMAFYSGQVNAAYLFENLLGDVIGGPVISLILVSLLIVSRFCFQNIELPEVARRSIIVFILIVLAFLVSCFAYFSAKLFYNPIPVKIDVTAIGPVSGMLGQGVVGRSVRSPADSKGDEPAYQFLPTQLESASISWRGKGLDKDKVKIHWERISSDAGTYELSVQVLADCAAGQIGSIGLLGSMNPISDVQLMNLSFDGYGEFGTVPGKPITSELAVHNNELSMFSLDRGDDANSIKLTQFLAKGWEAELKNEEDQLNFYINLPLFDVDVENTPPSPRSITLLIGGKELVMSMKPSMGARGPKIKNQCRLLGKPTETANGQLNFEGAKTSATIVLRIKRRAPVGTSSQMDPSSKVLLSGLNGWMTVALDGNSFVTAAQGKTDLVTFRGSVSDLEVDGKTIPVKPTDQNTAFGEFESHFEAEKSVRFKGIAKALWKNGVRVNPTRWEQITWDQQLKLFAIVLAIFGPLVALVIAIVRKDEPIASEYQIDQT